MPRRKTSNTPANAALLDRLRAHRTLSQMPVGELDWLVEHGTIVQYPAGQVLARKGDPIPGMFVVLAGRLSNLSDRGGTWRKVMEWSGGDVTGYLPYSRMAEATGLTVTDEPIEVLLVSREEAETLPMVCPRLTEALVHAMIDRTREFKSNDIQVEKFASLGKLAAGIAHELNNPASAALRCAHLLAQAFAETGEASRELEAAHLTASEQATLENVRSSCQAAGGTGVMSPLEQADREEAITAWLTNHGVDDGLGASLAAAGVSASILEKMSGAMDGAKLRAALRWLSAACVAQGLARDIEQASERVHRIVNAVKGFTYMDRTSVPEAVDVREGLMDTLVVLGSKAKEKAVTVQVEVATDLPRVNGFGSELNQVWANLIDNAIDAAAGGGRVTVKAAHNDATLFVRVIDDGPGIPSGIMSRIFDPFFTTKPVGAGAGLGLGIAQRLVAAHEGSVSVTSEPGRTEFCVTLPAADRTTEKTGI